MATSDSARPAVPRAERFQPAAEQWSPRRGTSELGPALVAAMRTALGSPTDGRPAHRHGTVWSGRFAPSGAAAGLSDFAGFRGLDAHRTLARFSNLSRKHGKQDIKGMAAKLVLPGGEVTDLVAMSAEVFPVRRSRQFLDVLEALRNGPVPALPSMAGMVLAGRLSLPAVVRGTAAIVRSRDVQSTTYHGVHTFRLVRTYVAHGGAPGAPPERRPVRFRWVPLASVDSGWARELSQTAQLRFGLELVLGDPRWKRVDDPTWRWPRDAPIVRAGVLFLDHVIEPEPSELAFNPGRLAPGLEPGDDDLFSDRAGAYAVAQAARRSE